MEEFFLMLVRLWLGLMEQDLAYRFGISQSTVSRITVRVTKYVRMCPILN